MDHPQPPTGHSRFDGPTQPGWQQHATKSLHTSARATVSKTWTPQGRQCSTLKQGPLPAGLSPLCHNSRHILPFTHIFRLLMLRRLRLPLPLSKRTCRCRRNVDQLGDHRADCCRTGVLRTRGILFEKPRKLQSAQYCTVVCECHPSYLQEPCYLAKQLTPRLS